MQLPPLPRRALLAACGACFGLGRAAADAFEAPRRRMLSAIETILRETSAITGRRQLSPRVAAALLKVPRQRFVPDDAQHAAYTNRPLSIGHGQTISQPFIVALMTELAEVGPGDRVLEIGTGSGYQAAVLAELAARVYTIEIVRPLGERARDVLRGLGYDNVETRVGDGYRGWPDAAPFDAIVVTAAPEQVPGALIDQLAPGGRLVAPVGPQDGDQQLLVLRKNARGDALTESVLPVRFVPMTR